MLHATKFCVLGAVMLVCLVFITCAILVGMLGNAIGERVTLRA